MSNPRERIPIGDRVVITTRGKKKTYVAEFTDNNEHRRLSLKTSNKKVAIDRATALAAKLLQGVYQPAPAAVGLDEAVKDYIAFLETEGRSRKTTVKYRGVYREFLKYLSKHGTTRLNLVLPGHLDRYRAERKKAASPKTMYTEGVIIKQLFRWCRSRKLISENPLADTKLQKPPMVPKPSPSLADVNAILAAANLTLRVRLAVLAFTGMRSGELQRLRPEDVDLKGKWIHVVSREGAETKSRRSRKVPIHERLLHMLETIPKGKRSWFFTSLPSRKYPDGDRPINTKRLNDAFAKVLKTLDLPIGRDKGYVIHSLRHFVETFAINNGIPQRVVDAWLGHCGDKSMGAVYYKLSDTDSQKFMAKLPFGAPDSKDIV